MKGRSSPSQLIHLSHLHTTENHKQATTQPLSLNTFCKPVKKDFSFFLLFLYLDLGSILSTFHLLGSFQVYPSLLPYLDFSFLIRFSAPVSTFQGLFSSGYTYLWKGLCFYLSSIISSLPHPHMRFHFVWHQWRCTPFDYRRLSFTTESPETFPQPITIQTLSFDLRTTAVSYPYWQHSKKAINMTNTALWELLQWRRLLKTRFCFIVGTPFRTFLNV